MAHLTTTRGYKAHGEVVNVWLDPTWTIEARVREVMIIRADDTQALHPWVKQSSPEIPYRIASEGITRLISLPWVLKD